MFGRQRRRIAELESKVRSLQESEVMYLKAEERSQLYSDAARFSVIGQGLSEVLHLHRSSGSIGEVIQLIHEVRDTLDTDLELLARLAGREAMYED